MLSKLCLLQVLETKQLNESHTGEVLAYSLDTTLISWGLQDKVFAITTDNAANMEKACQLWKEVNRQLSCFAHTMAMEMGNIELMVKLQVSTNIHDQRVVHRQFTPDTR